MTEGPELILVDSFDEAQEFARWLGERRPILAFDVETTGLDPWRDHIRLAQFGDANTGWALPYRDWRGLIKEVLERYDRPMVAHNMKFDVSMIEHDEIKTDRARFHDTMTMCHIEDSHGPKGLKAAAKRYVGAGSDRGEMELKAAMRKAGWTWATIPETFEAYWTYGALDTVLTARLAENLWRRIQPFRQPYELELAVTWVLLDMEQRGARVDLDYCRDEREKLLQEFEELSKKWPDIDLLSHGQLLDAFINEGVQLTKKTEKGNWSLDEEVLSSLDHPLAKDAIRARFCAKMGNTYFKNYLKYEVDGIVHCNVNPLGAEKTGRMSISRPSMQNIPRLKLVRDAIIAREDHSLVLTDYQAQETREIAHFAREQRMIKAFNEGVDIHTFVASMVYGIPLEKVTHEQRRRAKQCGHARNYGSGVPKLAATAGISLSSAREFMHAYDQTFPRISKFNAEVSATVRDREIDGYGYVISYSGRRIRVPVKKAYTGVNYLIQGSGSDILKTGLVNADRAGIAQYAVLPVHDEVVWDIPNDLIDEVLPEIHAAFEHRDLLVPLPIEEKIVEKWGDAYD